MSRPVTPDERARIIATLHETGNVRETARQVGRDPATVSRIATAEGIDTQRCRTKEATEARQADTDLRRVELRAALIEDAHRLRAQLWAPAVIHHWYQGEHFEHQIDEATTGDKRNLAIALGIVVDKAEALAKADGDDHSAVEAWLRAIVGGGER